MEGTIVFGLILITALTGFLLSANFFLYARPNAKKLNGVLRSEFIASAIKSGNRLLLEVAAAFVVKIAFWLHLLIAMPFTIYFAFQYELGSQQLAVAVAVAVGTSWVFNVIIDTRDSIEIGKNLPIVVPNDLLYWIVVAITHIPRAYPLYLLFCILVRG